MAPPIWVPTLAVVPLVIVPEPVVVIAQVELRAGLKTKFSSPARITCPLIVAPPVKVRVVATSGSSMVKVAPVLTSRGPKVRSPPGPKVAVLAINNVLLLARLVVVS